MAKGNFGIGLYSPKVAARIAKVRYQNFQAWAKANLLHPVSKISIGTRQENVYSYYDLLLIRLVVRLRDRGFSSKEIKRALEVIREISGGDSHAWMKATIYVADRLIVVKLAEREEWNPIAASKGPQKMALIFFPELIEELKRELVPERFRYIEINPEILAGAPVIKGTRIPTQAVALAKQSGQDPQVAYPTLTTEAIAEALEYEEFLEAA